MQCGMTSRVAPFAGSSQCARPAQKARLSIVAQAGTVTTRPPTEVVTEAKPASKAQAKIYVGKGRFVEDDPTKYPSRTETAGGWAGGEVGLKAFVADLKASGVKPAKATAVKEPKPIGRGRDEIYLGKGRKIRDDARKYPQRNELTGGFAGGELGLRTFLEQGDIPLLEPGQRGGQPQSPLLTAMLLGAAATIGGLVLYDAEEVAESALRVGVPAVEATAGVAGMDESTKMLLQAAVLLAGLTGVVAGGRAVVGAAANSLKEGAVKLGTLAVFWVAVFLAAQFVLSSP